MMSTVCEKCERPIALNATVVQCGGFCENSNRFHADCVGLSYDKVEACMHTNILWICDCCRDLLKNIKFRNAIKNANPVETPRDEIEHLKKEVGKINDVLMKLTTGDKISFENVLPKAENGAINTSFSSKIPQNTSIDSSQECANFSLFMTNIAPDVTDDEVSRLLHRNQWVDLVNQGRY
ncbi:uncharacterized protein LOC134222993 [Armigeres subalbatus]|uniref:uncharacterized protein LOC134222993 n=1 Tax=Armigeres subalbatus TaxID=124917 RepID=UPI002ED62706